MSSTRDLSVPAGELTRLTPPALTSTYTGGSEEEAGGADAPGPSSASMGAACHVEEWRGAQVGLAGVQWAAC